MKTVNTAATLLLIAGLGTAQLTLAASHDSALTACKAATEEAVGAANIRLSDINRRGKTYGFWLDVFPDAENSERMRSYCKAKGKDVLKLVTEKGVWNKTNKREVMSAE